MHLLTLAALAGLSAAVPTARSSAGSGSRPTAHVLNGTYTGTTNLNYNQDFFLGIPYAQQPVGDLRFALPKSLSQTWNGTRDAKEYGDICVGYGTDSIWYPQSEACLTLNVIRDSSVDETSSLPVAVWIHGGGFTMGSGADQRYNMSAIVANANKIGKPFIGVTLNYRLSTWGFIASEEVTSAGVTNLGLRDQRLALHWVQENIASFGGDPSKVTIFGESAGGMSVGNHLTAYGGRDDGLFRGAIMESGGSVTAAPMNTTGYQAEYDEIVEGVGCSDSEDTLQCLRTVPFESLNTLFNGSDGNAAYDFSPYIDGDFIQERGSVALQNGNFVKVPIISGTNTDEGASFGPTGINTTEQFYAYLVGGGLYTPELANQILELYPDDPSQGIPQFLGDQRIPSKGLQWRRASAYAGDYSMHANRRLQCESWANYNTSAYCYRFNTRGGDVPAIGGAQHFTEVAFVFNNLAGWGYHYGLPFAGMPERYRVFSGMVSSMWASFVSDLDPNSGVDAGGYDPEVWEEYATDKPVDLLLDANVTGFGVLEEDRWRKEGIDFLNEITRALDR